MFFFVPRTLGLAWKGRGGGGADLILSDRVPELCVSDVPGEDCMCGSGEE